jgi:protein required for attachment to host cells
MKAASLTWVVVANAERCRVLEERHYGDELHELRAWERRPTDEDRRTAHHAKAVQQQRSGFGQHVVNERDFAQQIERRFLARCANELNVAALKDLYQALILFAPARALGIVRGELSRAARERIERSEACDCVGQSAEGLRGRILRLRSPG